MSTPNPRSEEKLSVGRWSCGYTLRRMSYVMLLEYTSILNKKKVHRNLYIINNVYTNNVYTHIDCNTKISMKTYIYNGPGFSHWPGDRSAPHLG